MFKKFIYKSAKELNIKFLDGSKVIDANNLNDYAPEGGHLSKEGYQKLANQLAIFIKKN